MHVADLPAIRLRNQRLVGTKCRTPLEVVRHMGAIQAQDYGQAVWAIGSRLQKPSLQVVEASIANGEILRTWPMRGTVHFVPSEDAAWMVQLMSARPLASAKRRAELRGLDTATFDKCLALLQTALRGRKLLSRPSIMRLFEDNDIPTTGQRGYHILWYLAQTGHICMGPMEGKQQTFALLNEWAPATRQLSHEESLREIAARYIQSHGPATAQDLATWTKMKLSDIKTALELANDTVEAVSIDGAEYWQPRSRTNRAMKSDSVQLLPGFDEYLLGYKERLAVLDAEHATKIVPGGNGVFFPMLVIDGRICGTWKRTIKKSSVDITVTPFVKLQIDTNLIVNAAAQYAQFLGLEPNLTIAA